MNSPLSQITVGLVTASLMLAAIRLTVAPAAAKDTPARCVEGNLKDTYLGQECMLGNLTIRFDREFIGASMVDPGQVQVTPTTSPPVLWFAFPLITPEPGGKTTISFFSSVRGSGAALTAATLSADLDGKKVRVQAFVSDLPKKEERDFSILQVLSTVSTVQGSFASPAPEAVRVGYHLDVEEAAQPTFWFTLTGG
jgi:hypothetical protein